MSPAPGLVTYVLLSRLPLSVPAEADGFVRLACIKRTASVRPEPGSNSSKIDVSFYYPNVKVPIATIEFFRLPVLEDVQVKNLCSSKAQIKLQ